MGWAIGRHPLDPEPPKPRLPPEIWERLPIWREKWSEIWYVEISRRHYVYRSPTRQETIDFNLNVPNGLGMAADNLVTRCLLYPGRMPDDVPVNDLITLFEYIWGTSGFQDPEAFEEEVSDFEEVVRAPDQLNIAMVLRAFPGLLPDQVNSWQHEKLCYHVALARLLLGVEPPGKPKAKPQIPFGPPPAAPQTQPQAPAQAPKPKARNFDWEKDKAELEQLLRG